jgi:hypothetical protein
MNDGNLEADSQLEQYGLHEPYSYYRDCMTRDRNEGLWIADRTLNGDNARFTRQNNNGNRRGLECPEERDYYPYWHPSPWKDIAVLTESEKYCDTYTKESQNVKSKYWCREKATGFGATANNEDACQGLGEEFEWVAEKSHGIGAPRCILAPWSRDNHLGNGATGKTNSYAWKLPGSGQEGCIDDDNCNCVLRIRYNMSSTDLNYDKSDRNDPARFIDWSKNEESSPISDDQISEQDGLAMELAMDTSQFGRTFQDRSHIFHIKKRPGVSCSCYCYRYCYLTLL